jgi:hypothetical protein
MPTCEGFLSSARSRRIERLEAAARAAQLTAWAVRLAAKFGRPVAEVRAELGQYDRRLQALTALYGDDVEHIMAVIAAEEGLDAGALLREAERLAEA